MANKFIWKNDIKRELKFFFYLIFQVGQRWGSSCLASQLCSTSDFFSSFFRLRSLHDWRRKRVRKPLGAIASTRVQVMHRLASSTANIDRTLSHWNPIESTNNISPSAVSPRIPWRETLVFANRVEDAEKFSATLYSIHIYTQFVYIYIIRIVQGSQWVCPKADCAKLLHSRLKKVKTKKYC